NVADATCLVPNDRGSREAIQTIPATADLSLKFEVLDGISGNVLITESDAEDSQDVRISIQMRATSTQLLEQLEQRVSRFNEPVTNNGYFSVVHIHDRNGEDMKKKLLHKNCARADIVIVYPRSSPGTGKLQVLVGNGELTVKMKPLANNGTMSSSGTMHPGTLASFEEVDLELMNGGINIENLVASRRLHAGVFNGYIHGHVHSAGKITARTMNGQIQLTVDTELLRPDWNPYDLTVAAETLSGEIALDLVRRFAGHFKISTTIGTPTINQSNNNTDILKYSRQHSKILSGWISADGSEPSNSTPRLDLETVNGAITLKFGA
ncbi:hypothetical protein BGZ65_009875, partial [Modicella reniformis]